MADPPSPIQNNNNNNNNNDNRNGVVDIPIEIVSEEEMAFIEAALAAAETHFTNTLSKSKSSLVLLRNNNNVTFLSNNNKRSLSACSNKLSDIEDSGRVSGSKKPRDSFLRRFRKGRGLSVTDLTATEWCEKQIEFGLLFGKPKRNAAMKAGSARHAKLEAEVIKREKIRVELPEDMWAVRFINFIVGTNQLLFDGLTRELPLVGFVEGVWMVGIIDEIRMPLLPDSGRFPLLVDTKTRVRPTVPSEPQKRNGRLQLMCYKYLWDCVVAEKFPKQKFFEFFSLNPNQILSKEIRESTDKAGFPSQTLTDLIIYFGNSCCLLPRAHDQLLLRYELQKDQSLLGEDEFDYEPEWVKGQITSCLEFWMGEREASYTPMEERWKCGHCSFANRCPAFGLDASSSQSMKEDTNASSTQSTKEDMNKSSTQSTKEVMNASSTQTTKEYLDASSSQSTKKDMNASSTRSTKEDMNASSTRSTKEDMDASAVQ